MLRFIKRLWTGETDGLTAAAFLVGVASIASRLIGVVRDHALASAFGAGTTLDAYYAAFRLPDMLYNLIILGALSSGFIPVFTEYLERDGKEKAYRLASQVLSIVGFAMAIACAFLAIFAGWIVPLITPGFDAEKMRLTIDLSRIMFLSPLFLGLSAVMGGVLQSTRRFFAFALAPILYNVGIIIGVLVFAKSYGIRGVAWGVVLGAAMHFFAQASVAWKLGFNHLPFPSLRPEGVRRILKLMIPRTAGLAVSQMNLVVLLAIASSLESGAISVFNFANNLQSFPVGIIGVSFAIAAFPALARSASAKKMDVFHADLLSAAKKILYLILPMTALFLLLRAQIVRLMLGAGAFDWSDTIRTADVFGWLSVSLLAQSLVALLARAFYAIQDTWTPFWISVAAEIVNIALALLLRGPFGIAGLAVAFSVAAFVQMLLLCFWLRRRAGAWPLRPYVVSIGKTGVAVAGLFAVAYPLRQWIGTVYPLHTVWQVALQTVVPGLTGCAAFLFVSWLVKSSEFLELRDGLSRKIWRRGKVSREGADAASGMGS